MIRGRLKKWKRSLLLGLWVFSPRTHSSVTEAGLPTEVVAHILSYLRTKGFRCARCDSWIPIVVSIYVPTATYLEDYPDDVCCRLPTPPFDFYADGLAYGGYANLYEPFLGPARYEEPPAAYLAARYEPRQPPPSIEDPAPRPGVDMRTHFVSLERARERERRKPYQPPNRGRKK